MKEEWTPLFYLGTIPTQYVVSNTGQVENIARRGVAIKTRNVKGYPYVNINVSCRGVTLQMHRVVALHFVPNPQGKPQINHIDGDRQNNKAENLEWCTCHENLIHSFKLGLSKPKRGEKNDMAKLSEEEVKEIRIRYALDHSRGRISFLAKEYHIGHNAISDIVRRKKWRHI